MLITIQESQIKTNNNQIFIKDYYEYILEILKNIIKKYNLAINIILGDYEYNFENTLKTIKININYEHTLVKEGGRDVPMNTPYGNIQYNTTKNYLVRIENYHILDKSDLIIDYSFPNLFNVKSCNLFTSFSKKHLYISPSLYNNLYINNKNRNIQSLTTFFNINEPRRYNLLTLIKQQQLEHQNINDCFDKNNLQMLYQNTKIVINIHQTEHHHTFEELRCLPALQNGVIVISENSPLMDLIPYKNLIIWTDYDNIISKTKEILNNYEQFYNSIFTSENISILKNMDIENNKTMEEKIFSIVGNEDLSILAERYSLDKSITTGNHNYIPCYTKLFQNIRYNVKNLLEIGIGSLENNQMGGINGELATTYNYKTGNSLKCWEDFFQNANIYGIDIYSHTELNKNRIMTFAANQNSEYDLKIVMDKINTNLDIIIDDGSHNWEHQVFSFMFLNKYLSSSGIYIIEDIQSECIERFKDLSIFPNNFKDYIIKTFNIEYFDMRNTCNRYRNDDFMIAFTKKYNE